MAQRKKSEIEFIQDTFCPQVAVLCSYDAEVVCRKNALTFVELVQPFAFGFNGEIKISDPSNNLLTIKNLRVEIKDINLLPLQPLLAKKILDDSVSSFASNQNVIEKYISNGIYNFVTNVNTPWFESWRDLFIKTGPPDEHEFLKHFISCIFVVSTGHIDPLDQFQKLIIQHQQTTQNVNRFPKWFFPNIGNIYRYFVLLHDVSEGEISKAHQIYEQLKNIYGSSNCHLLQINSKSLNSTQPVNMSSTSNSANSSSTSSISSQQIEFDPWLQYCKFNELITGTRNLIADLPNSPIDTQKTLANELGQLIDHPLNSESSENTNENASSFPMLPNGSNTTLKRHGQCLAPSDHDRIKTFISEYLQRGLVPYAERTIKILNEQIQSKKSILKSFSIPRRIFGSSNSSSSNVISSSNKSSQQSPIVAISTSGLNSTNVSSNGMSSNGLVTITSNFVNTNDEFQLRRLADLAFMFRLYDLAYTSYHSCKKDFSNFLTNQSNNEQLLSMNFYLAGSLEMASISNFMQQYANDFNSLSTIPNSSSTSSLSSLGSSSIKSYNTQYIEDATHLLLNTCKSSYFSTRAILLSTEALRANSSFLRAAYQFINFPSDESDIRSGLFLEQAAQCYLAQPQPFIRKYAFFMSLAGHRFNQVGQKKHALRVYKQALDIYENRQWFRAQDHIHFVMSRLNFNLKDMNEALNHILEILVKKNKTKKKHEVHDFGNETNVLKDFILYSNTLNMENDNKLTNIPIPLIDYTNVKVNLAPHLSRSNLRYGKILVKNDFDHDYIEENFVSLTDKLNDLSINNQPSHLSSPKERQENKELWQKLEESLYVSSFRTLPILFKPQLQFLDKTTDNKQMPKVVVNESVSVMFEIKNHLRISLILTEITLLWKFIDQSTTASISDESSKPFEVSNECKLSDLKQQEIVECSTLKELTLSPHESYKLRLTFKPLRSHGHLHIMGLKYRLGLTSFSSEANNTSTDFNTLYGKHLFELRGPRLNNNSQAMRSVLYDTDNRLNFKIVNKTAQLQIEMDSLPNTMICNQFERVRIYFSNLSNENPIGNIKIASNEIQSYRLHFNDSNKKERNEKLQQEDSLYNFDKNIYDFKKETTNQEQQQQSFQLNVNNSSNESTGQKINNNIYSLDSLILNPNEHYILDMWIRAPESEGVFKFFLMFFYEDFNGIIHQIHAKPSPKRNSASTHSLKYRVIRYEFSIKTVSSLSVANMNIVNSQSNTNLLVNLEISNQQSQVKQTSFELVDSYSVSDIWRAWPMSSTSDFTLKPLMSNVPDFVTMKKNKEILSTIFKAQPANTKSHKNENEKVYIFKSKFKDETQDNSEKPDDNVLLYFINSDLKKQFLNESKKSNCLNLNLIWKSHSFTDQDTDIIKYGILPIQILGESCLNSNLNSPAHPLKFIYRQLIQEQLDPLSPCYKLDPKEVVLITLNSKPNIIHNFTKKNICVSNVLINLTNLSIHRDFEIILIVKNSKSNEIENSYLWLGCTQKHVRLKSKQTKVVKFKLGFLRNGLFEVGSVSNDNILKMNLFEATNSFTNFENLMDKKVNSSGNNFGNESNTNNGLHNLIESTAISVYLKSSSTNRYEFFKILNSFTVCVSS